MTSDIPHLISEIQRLRGALEAVGKYCDDTRPLPLNSHRITIMIREALTLGRKG